MYNSKKMNGALRELWNFSLKQEYPLHSAATTGNIELLNHLLEQGYELTDIDNYGDTPLHCASSEGQIGIIQYITSHKKCSIVLNQINFKGITPLAVACAEGQFDCAVKLLKTPNCKVNHKYEKSSALHLAVASDNVDCVELLVNCGSKVNKRNEFGETALHVALRGLRNSCAPDALTLETIECIKLILNTGKANVDAMFNGSSPLHIAAAARCEGLLIYLLDSGASANFTDSNGYRAIDLLGERDPLQQLLSNVQESEYNSDSTYDPNWYYGGETMETTRHTNSPNETDNFWDVESDLPQLNLEVGDLSPSQLTNESVLVSPTVRGSNIHPNMDWIELEVELTDEDVTQHTLHSNERDVTVNIDLELTNELHEVVE